MLGTAGNRYNLHYNSSSIIGGCSLPAINPNLDRNGALPLVAGLGLAALTSRTAASPSFLPTTMPSLHCDYDYDAALPSSASLLPTTTTMQRSLLLLAFLQLKLHLPSLSSNRTPFPPTTVPSLHYDYDAMLPSAASHPPTATTMQCFLCR